MNCNLQIGDYIKCPWGLGVIKQCKHKHSYIVKFTHHSLNCPTWVNKDIHHHLSSLFLTHITENEYKQEMIKYLLLHK